MIERGPQLSRYYLYLFIVILSLYFFGNDVKAFTTVNTGWLLSRSQFSVTTSLLQVKANKKGISKICYKSFRHVTKIDKSRSEDVLETSSVIMSRRNALLSTAATLSILFTTASSCNAMVTKTESQFTDSNSNTNSNMIATNTEKLNTAPSSSLTTIQETISGFVSGATITTTKTLVKYPLDTATVRLQMKSTPYTIFKINDLFKGSYNGITTPLVSNIPAGALFFAIKDATKSILKSKSREYGIDVPKWVSTCIAVGVATPPYWLLRNPSEVIKTRQQVGKTSSVTSDDEVLSAWEAIQVMYQSNNNSTIDSIKDLYSGFLENILYGYPADVIKFVAYEGLSSSFSADGKDNGKISPMRGALYGAGATAIAQFLTTPLDVVRNRIMAETKNNQHDAITISESKTKDDTKSLTSQTSYIDTLTTLAKDEGLKGLFAGATPRIGKALLSGAIQFATYEETKETFRKMFEKR